MKLDKFRLLVHLGALIPLGWLIWDAIAGNLTVNPIRAITLRTGKYTLVLLVLTLAATPLNTIFNFPPARRVRRALGLYTFFYASLHFLSFLVDYGWVSGLTFDWQAIYAALFKKNYALLGLAAFALMAPLAITSFKWWMKRLGAYWQKLHRLIYLAGLLGVMHFLWLVKADYREPLAYGALVVVLLLLRVPPIAKLFARGAASPESQ